MLLQRVRSTRKELKYFEAGLDLKLSLDPEESYRIFQGRLLEQYLGLSSEFGFYNVEASQPVEAQQTVLREVLAARLDLGAFRKN